MRYSRQRKLIMEWVQKAHDHPTATEIFGAVKKDIPNISLGTVYRNLKQLVEHGFLRSMELNGVVHYDADLSDHQHFLCNHCYRIYDITLPVLNIDELQQQLGHQIDTFEFRFKGLCIQCQKESKEK